jgi:hypothetical protein
MDTYLALKGGNEANIMREPLSREVEVFKYK